MKLIAAIPMLLVCAAATAQTRVVVVPLGGDALPLQNVVTVAKKNGDFTDPVEAMAYIASESKDRYLLLIGPGAYTLTETLVMEPFVDISGSGRNATLLRGAIRGGSVDQSAIVQGANNSGIQSLSIENTGGDAYSVGVYNDNASPMMSDINIEVSGGLPPRS